VKISLEKIEEARKRITSVINPTPLQFSTYFSAKSGNQIFLKPENLQKTGSFKIRGSYNAISRLSREERRRGVIAISAGNHGQGVAYAASLLGTKAVVVMPENAVDSKVRATEGYGAEILLYGKNSEELYTKAKEIQKKYSYHFIFDDEGEDVIAGQGTIAIEILEEVPDTEIIICPVGGGGLISGIAFATKQINPKTKVIGVQPYGANAMFRSIKAGRSVALDSIETMADGLAVKKVKELTLRTVRDWVDGWILVTEDEIREALLLLLERAKMLVEPSGAAAMAAAFREKVGAEQKRIVVLLTGGNMDLPLLKKLI
jgi:threonine dehydratase